MQGALGVNSALFSFAFIVFNFLATATTPLIATSLARGDKQQVCLLILTPWLHNIGNLHKSTE